MENNQAQVVLVADINPSSDYSNSSPSNFAEFNGKLYFGADDGENGRELWVSDGTTEGTRLVADISSGYSYPRYLTELNGRLYFTADDGENGRELWVSDGTAEGTQLVADINPGNSDGGYPNSSNPEYLTAFEGKLYFNADDGENGRELWVSDGTTEGTQLLEDINSSNSDGGGYFDSSNPRGFTVFDGELFFSADDGEIGRELYKLTFEDVVEPGGSGNIEGTLGADTIEGTNSGERIKGLAGNDVINSLGGNDLVFGDVGNDDLNAGDGDDTIYGGTGNDTMTGGAGNDLLVGQEGNDFFVLTSNEGTDTINDFNLEDDRFILSGSLVFEDLSFSDDGILAGEETLATLNGISTENLSSSNFIEV